VLVHDGRASRIEAGGLPVGMFCGAEYETTTVTMAEGDTLALYTDGLSETEDETVAEDGEDENEGAPHMPPDIPEVIVDALFASFMESVRGINSYDLDDAAYDKARAEFTASFAHAFAGDRVNFENPLRAGSHDSAANAKP
jgi:hypothetical protein